MRESFVGIVRLNIFESEISSNCHSLTQVVAGWASGGSKVVSTTGRGIDAGAITCS